MKNPVGATGKREECVSLTCRPGGHALSVGVEELGVGSESVLAVTVIWVRLGEKERKRERVNWMTSLLLHCHYFLSQPLWWDLGRLCTRKFVQFPSAMVHVYTHTHTVTQGERKRSYDSSELRGQRLPLHMAHSHVQPLNGYTNHTLALSHTHTWP